MSESAVAVATSESAVAQLRSVRCWYKVGRRAGLGRGGVVRAVDGVSLTVPKGRTLGLIGESGSGKTTIARLLLRMQKPSEGRVLFEGNDLETLSRDGLKTYRRSVQAVFQDPVSAFDPRMRLAESIAEPLRVQGTDRDDARRRTEEVLDLVGLGSSVARRFPHEVSGGQLQRIAIARAITGAPSLIVLDEPVASLDVSIRGQIVNLLMDLRRAMSLTYVLISHEFSSARHLSDDVQVMYGGKIVEWGPSEEVYADPRHPYTQLMIASAKLGERERREYAIPDAIDSRAIDETGCRFKARCPFAMPVCGTTEPLLRKSAGRSVACHLYEPDEPGAGDEASGVGSISEAAPEGVVPGRRFLRSSRSK